jgi:eukaryotic-like serine/threonine-protein kinase
LALNPLGEQGGEAADMWAIGVLAYEMLTGKYPFARSPGTPGFTIASYRRFRPVSEQVPDAPAEWEDFFAHALAFEPADRPVSPKLLFEEFQRLFHNKAEEDS